MQLAKNTRQAAGSGNSWIDAYIKLGDHLAVLREHQSRRTGRRVDRNRALLDGASENFTAAITECSLRKTRVPGRTGSAPA